MGTDCGGESEKVFDALASANSPGDIHPPVEFPYPYFGERSVNYLGLKWKFVHVLAGGLIVLAIVITLSANQARNSAKNGRTALMTAATAKIEKGSATQVSID
jgi:hypothetical protein